ncbi:MAG: transglycosylase SLT domain-containing protein [Flavobacteriaceae bacterium]|nr:transglycosylase SLT domain-containing protein [Flavobacteriaceae bacterium]
MKKLLFFSFLVFSPLLFSQSSYQSSIDNHRNYPIFNQNNPVTFSERNLTILDKDYSEFTNNNWLLNPSILENSKSEFSSLLLKKQLEELDHLTPFQLSHNPTLERFIRVYLNDRRESISKLMDRATYYFPIFEEYLDKYDLPLEIKYLAIIESALKPNANSSSGAKGLWQFMFATGKQYGLQVNSYVDDRFDPIKSTEAACKYLSDLYNMFDDWDLALAAYNSGPGNVRKAIKRAGGKRNYWEIRQFLPQETHGYLPAFYATYYIFEYADTHHLKPISSKLTYFEVDTVHVKKQLSFTRIQKNISIKNELLKALNPQYKREIIPYSKNKKYVLTLPKNLIDVFIEKENSIYQSTSNNLTYSKRIDITEKNSYIVRTDDNLNKIAYKHHITLSQLKTWNGLQTNYLISGQRLVITDKKTSQLLSKIEIEKTKINSNNFETYIVKKGDTLFNISKKYNNVTILQIQNWNDINNVRYLKPGTKLRILKS